MFLGIAAMDLNISWVPTSPCFLPPGACSRTRPRSCREGPEAKGIFLNFRVPVNNMEHELCDEGGGNCWLLPFLLPTARRELFYRRIWLCNSPAGVCPALPKSAVRARLSGGSRRLRLPGLQHAAILPPPSADPGRTESYWGPEPSLYFPLYGPQAPLLGLRSLGTFIPISLAHHQQSSFFPVSVPDCNWYFLQDFVQQEPKSHSRICLKTSVFPSQSPFRLKSSIHCPRVDSGVTEAQSFLPFTPGQIMKHPHHGAWIPTCSSCIYLPTLAPEKALIYHNGQDAKDTLQKRMHLFVILSPLPGPLPINKTQENFFPPTCPWIWHFPCCRLRWLYKGEETSMAADGR